MLAAREARDAFFYSHIIGLVSQRHVRSMPTHTWQDDSALIVLMAKELVATASMLKQSTSALSQVYHCFSLAFLARSLAIAPLLLTDTRDLEKQEKALFEVS